jgi:hypothetical protein
MPFIMFPILYVLWKIKTRVPVVKVADMDFITDIAEIEADMCVFGTTLMPPNFHCVDSGTMNLHRGTSWRHSGRGW